MDKTSDRTITHLENFDISKIIISNLHKDFFEKLTQRHTELMDIMNTGAGRTPEAIAAAQEYENMDEIVAVFQEYKKTLNNYEQNVILWNDFQDDTDFLSTIVAELHELQIKIQVLTTQLQDHFKPKKIDDSKNVIIEVRGAAGGQESSLFAYELFFMYQRYADMRKWKYEVLTYDVSPSGGIKEGALIIKGKGVFTELQYEKGVHRVQRVPDTEKNGRIHTSTVTVAVIVEADEIDVNIEEKFVRLDTFCSQGAGGQSVNTTKSAVRLTYNDGAGTLIVVSQQDERSQDQNKKKAYRVLRARLQAIRESAAHSTQAQEKKSQLGTGERSEKQRTYNFAQDRITDHVMGMSFFGIKEFLAGGPKMKNLIDARIEYELMNVLEKE